MWPAIIGAVGALGAGLLGKSGQESANEKNLQIAREQMAFQKEMSNTSYQRAITDMRKAGINPMLAVSKGGASTPQGASATMQNTMAPLQTGIQGGITSALDAYRTEKQGAQLDAQTKKTLTEVGQVQQQISNMREAKKLTENQTLLVAQQAINTRGQLELMKQQAIESLKRQGLIGENTKAAKFDNVEREIMAKFWDSAEFLKVAKSIGINSGLLKAILKPLLSKGK